MSQRTKCNYCTLQWYKRRYGDNLIVKKVETRVPKLTKEPWTEAYLKDKEGNERFLAAFVAVTNQCVCG